MDYYKIKITALPPEEWLFDVIMAGMADEGFESFTDAESGFDAFIPVNLYDENSVNNILDEYKSKFSFKIEKTFIKSQNWNSEWEENYFNPVVIADECLVRSPLHKDYPHCRFEIVIEPGMSFGTGTHETTELMIKALLKSDLKDKSVLDMGCGTGVLSILASLMGASSVTAVDIDKRAVSATLKNCSLNKIKKINVTEGDLSVVNNQKFDIILANIFKNIHLVNMESYYRILNDNGLIYLSGFFTEDVSSVKNESEKWGFKEISKSTKNNWVIQILKKELL
jgi:ribosomal protein L11 methyltransferase